ncbi:MAG: phosphotransferase [Eubacteriales bacterium]|nr:phosphotransferase [Eubacteriales bacterium]
MRSKTKPVVGEETVRRLFTEAGISDVRNVSPLKNGEFSAVCSVDTPKRGYVLKVSPQGDEHCMTYERDMLSAEVFWYCRIREQTDIRVPEILLFDDSLALLPAAYCIMERLEGETLPKACLTAKERAEIPARLAGMLAKIHAVSNDRFGYEQGRSYATWGEAIRGFVAQALEDCVRKRRRSRRGERLLRRIDEHRAALEGVSPVLVNFDLWPSNVIVRRAGSLLQYAWIDPERSFWGDPVVDFVCLAFSRPLSSAAETIAAYNAATKEPIEITRDTCVRYAVGQGYLALIMETEKYYRYSPLQFGWWRNVLAAHLLYRAAFRELES